MVKSIVMMTVLANVFFGLYTSLKISARQNTEVSQPTRTHVERLLVAAVAVHDHQQTLGVAGQVP